MARRYGNAGNVSSLISSARSAYEKSQNLQDQIEGYNWELSAKTAEDAQKYVDYLNKRAKSYEGIDPSKQITLQQKANSANRSFVSAETGRLSNQVLEGNMSNTQKYSQLKGLYQQAVDSGDENLAQRLYGTLDRLSMTIQNEQIAAANAASAASDKAYAAVKKGIESQISANSSAATALDQAFKLGEIDRKEYLTKKAEIVRHKQEVLKAATGLDSSGNFTNPQGLKAEDLNKYANDFAKSATGDNAKYTGAGGALLDKGLSPYNTQIDPVTGEVKLTDRSIVGNNWQGPQFADSVDKAKVGKAFKKLGFDTANIGDKGKMFTLPDGTEVFATVDNPDKPTKAIYRDPRTGALHQITPDGKSALLYSSPTSDYASTLDPSQSKIASEERMKQSDSAFGGFAGVARNTPLVNNYADSLRSVATGKGKLGDAANLLSGGFFGAAGDAMSKLSQITGLQKMVDEKRAAEAQRQAQVMEANRAQAAAQQASYQAQLAKSSVPAAPGKQLVYDWKTNTVQNKLSPVFKDPLSNNPDLRAQQVIRGGLGSNSIYNKLR